MSHQIQKIKSLRQGEKALRDNVPIRFNEWNTVTVGNLSNLPKMATVKFTVLTNNHGVGASNHQKETSHRSQMGLRLDCIEDNPKSVIETQLGKKHKGKCGYCGKWGHHRVQATNFIHSKVILLVNKLRHQQIQGDPHTI